tara:strand:+ start:1102 stop:1335 length:234 start_codon:yes stop_codon:yes gene_type:complete
MCQSYFYKGEKMSNTKTKKKTEMSVKIEGRSYKVSKGDILIVAEGVDIVPIAGLMILKMNDRVEVIDAKTRAKLGLI